MICLWVWIQIKARSGRGLYIRSQADECFSLIFIGNIIGDFLKIHCVCVCVCVCVCLGVAAEGLMSIGCDVLDAAPNWY